jgi:sulfoxide reductase heme-binding subunit YedZ
VVLKERLRKHGFRYLVHAAALTPLLVMLWDYWQGNYLVDPIAEVTSRTGKTALILLVSSLACTPLNTLFGFKAAIKVRRALGLYGFMYVSLHFLVFIWLNYGLDWGLIISAVLEQRFVIVGFAAGVLLIPLALTSTKGSMKRLGKNWKRLHRLIYLIAGLYITHYLWLVKDYREPLIYASIVVLLLILRIPAVRKNVSQWRRKIKSWLKQPRGIVNSNT